MIPKFSPTSSQNDYNNDCESSPRLKTKLSFSNDRSPLKDDLFSNYMVTVDDSNYISHEFRNI